MNGQSGVSHSEAQSVGDIVDGLEDAIGIDVLVTSSNTGESVSRLLLGRVQVGVSVVGVAKFILKCSRSVFKKNISGRVLVYCKLVGTY